MAKTKIVIKKVEDSDIETAGGSINAQSNRQKDDETEIELNGITKTKLRVAGHDLMAASSDQWRKDLMILRQDIVEQLSGTVRTELDTTLSEVQVLLEAEEQPDPSLARNVWERLDKAWRWVATLIQITGPALDAFERIRDLIQQHYIPS